ncbi:MAG: LysR family transcriptional regulator, partial [Eubacteriales bacterium]|nr:LysR family transcriptional regulator [Eubacteriales bacterium]
MVKYLALVKIAELGSISKAAAAMGYSQPGLSHILNSFEEELGFKIFVRSTNGITLTEIGEEVLKYSKEILASQRKINEAVRSRNELSSGTIRIGAFASALVSFLPKALKRFSEEYPNVDIQIDEYQGENMVEDIKAGEIDIAFVASNVDTINLDVIPPGYRYEHLLTDRMCLLLHKDHPLAKKEKIHFADLIDCVLMVPSIAWADVLQVDLSNESFKSYLKYIIRSDLAIFAMVSNDMGVALVSNLEKPIHFNNTVFKDFEE